ncbi:MAG: alpha/beta hydrolase [Clostridiales bacterium]|nr:alpha/beta hydrolase [Clostridiales bacterium]
MKIIKTQLWDKTPGMCEEIPQLTAYIPENKRSDAAVVIMPGGGYAMRADHEGKGYAEFLADNGYTAFVCDYRVAPHRFPLPLLDSRRAVRTVRANAAEYGIDKNKVLIMGSSAGGHLAALTSTYYEKIEFEGIDEIDREDFIPNGQILCYPVIKLLDKGHLGSGENLMGDRAEELGEKLSPNNIVTDKTPPAFIWSTFSDGCVPVENSIDYAEALHNAGIGAELHVYPDGNHGLGLANGGECRANDHVSSWSGALLKWLEYNNF